MNTENISVIVPAYNEESYIEKTINAIGKWPIQVELIVVNDGSTDKTKERLEDISSVPRLILVNMERNQGKGQALMEGIKKANGDLLVFLDADLGDSAIDAHKLLAPIQNGLADMTVAILPRATKKGGFGLVKKLARRGIYYFTGYDASAPLSGQRALRKEVLDKIPNLVSGFGIEVGLTIDVIKKGFTIKEVEIPLNHRETGRDFSGFIHRGKEFISVLRALIASFRKYKA